jgi:polyphosphate glucokinase
VSAGSVDRVSAPPPVHATPHDTAHTLAVDCGGGGIKASVLDAAGTLRAPAIRVPTPYPLPPERLLDTIADIAATLPPAERATVGMPGMIRHGVVVATPHYVTRTGPHSRVLPELVEAWSGFDMEAAVARTLGMPALVLNDAEVHGAGVVAGSGLELVLTVGTGLGSALFDGGALAPHLELSHAPVRWGTSYDTYIGEVERARLGDALWSRRVRRVVEGLRPVFLWDRLYLGGGNARRLTPQVLARLGDDVVVVPNSAGIVGGVRAWSLRTA